MKEKIIQEEEGRNFDLAAEICEIYESLLKYAIRLCKNINNAEDLVQETVERALKFQSKFDGRNTKAWLFSILRNTFIRRQKQMNVRSNLEGIFLNFNLSAELHCPSNEICWRDFDEDTLKNFEELLAAIEKYFSPKIIKALRQINASMAHRMLLSYALGIDHKQVALLLNIRPGTVLSGCSRGIVAIKNLLEGERASI